MYSARYSPKWFSIAINKAREGRTRTRRVQIDSSASDRSVEARRPHHRKEPTSGRGKAKRVMAVLTTYSYTGPDKRHLRQVIPRVFHALDPPGFEPPFPPRIARPRGIHRNDSQHLSPETRPTLGALVPHGNHFSDGSSHPQLTPQSLKIITAATIAALNQHLASIGLLLRMATIPSDESITNTAFLPPAARDASTIPPRTLPPPPAPRHTYPWPGFTQPIHYEERDTPA